MHSVQLRAGSPPGIARDGLSLTAATAATQVEDRSMMRDALRADWRIYQCRWCSAGFRRTARRGRKPEFCSDSCRMAFWAKVRWTDQNAFRACPARVIAESNEIPTKKQTN